VSLEEAQACLKAMGALLGRWRRLCGGWNDLGGVGTGQRCRRGVAD